jgi:hypothetical protein
MIYMIQMSMFFAGIATLFQTIGDRPCGRAPADRAGHVLRLHPDHDPAGRGTGCRRDAVLMGGIVVGGPVPRHSRPLHRQDPLRAAAAGHRAGRDDDRAGTGQGRHPIRGGRRPGDRHRGIRLASELDRCRCRDPRDPRPEVLRAWDAVGLGGPDRPARGLRRGVFDGHGEFRERGSGRAPSPCRTRSISGSSSR